eukprot:Tbor_TRINITY_DN6068_c1_g1::TRINITY_DN6068_c1_g1_i1::g.10711::m.10711/K11086/SNRPB, SMB; small nuclear ribonucleoprotein B and B'
MISSKMIDNLNQVMHVTIDDGRELTGTMLSFDRHMDLVLADTSETKHVAGSSVTRRLGMIVLRGERVVTIRAEGKRRNEHNVNGKTGNKRGRSETGLTDG